MAYKKTNEAYFGDSFNRPSTVTCYAASSTDKIADLTGYITLENDGTLTMANKDIGSWTDSCSTVACSGTITGMDLAIKSVDNLSDELIAIKAQIDDLKQNFVPKTGANKLRSALKTLSYSREV